MDIPDDYDILFLQGGASLQFSIFADELFNAGANGALHRNGRMV